MLKILVPLAGKSEFFPASRYRFGKHLVEIDGEPMIAHAVRCLSTVARDHRFAFVVRKEEAAKFYVDRTLTHLTDGNCDVVVQQGDARGAVCSCLLAIDEIDRNEPLAIANADQVIDWDLNAALDFFDGQDFDAGTICFDSVHPRWSYVVADERGEVWEAAEKRPISRDAIAGFYYYRRGGDFIDAAMQSIERCEETERRYFIAPCFNELILAGKRVGMVRIPPDRYHSFYSPQRVRAYEQRRLRGPRAA